MSLRNVQWMDSVLVPPHSVRALGLNTDGTSSQMLPWSESWPYVIPVGHWLLIFDATLQSKMISKQMSYFTLNGLFSVPSQPGRISLTIPWVLPSTGNPLTAAMINNSNTTQWMNCSMHGVLVPKTSEDYKDALAQYKLLGG